MFDISQGNIATKRPILNTMLDFNNATTAKHLQDAKDSKSLTLGTSAFVEGAQFTISSYEYVPIDETKADTRFYPAFTTELGTLSVTSLTKAKPVKPYVDKTTGETIFAKTPNGTLSVLIRKVLNENRGKSTDEVMPLLVAACKDKKFVVRQREYVVRETTYGDRAVPLAHIDIVVE